MAAYKKVMADVAALFLDPLPQEKDKKMTSLEAALEEVFTLEQRLVLASSEGDRPPEALYSKMTLAELSSSSQLNWTSLLNEYIEDFRLNYSFSDEDEVIVEDRPYYQSLAGIITATPTHVLYNYLGLKVAWSVSGWSSQALRDIDHAYHQAVLGVQQVPPLWSRCLQRLNSLLGYATTRLYLDNLKKEFGGDKVVGETKAKAEEVVVNLKAALQEMITSSEWLDEDTKAKALEKAQATAYYVSHPLWLEDDEVLDERHSCKGGKGGEIGDNSTSTSPPPPPPELPTITKGNLLRSVIDLFRCSERRQFSELHQPINLTLNAWSANLLHVNAAAEWEQNSISK